MGLNLKRQLLKKNNKKLQEHLDIVLAKLNTANQQKDALIKQVHEMENTHKKQLKMKDAVIWAIVKENGTIVVSPDGAVVYKLVVDIKKTSEENKITGKISGDLDATEEGGKFTFYAK
jgi:hypothetical protein